MTTRAEKRSRRTVVFCATERPGGIRTVVDTLVESPLGTRWSIDVLPTHGAGSITSRVARFGVGTWHLLRRVASGDAPLVHLHSAAHGSFVRKAILVWLAGAAGARVVLHVHSGHIEEFFESLPRHLQAVLIATLRRADRVIALGETWAERLRTIAPGAQVCVIANPVQLPARTASGGPGPVRVVFLGPMREDKGFFHLLDAWSAMTREPGCPTARLVVAGDGDRHRVVARVAELGITSSVELLPWQDVEAVGELLASAHALVLPSLAEGQPMSVLEAMAHGLCVVASAVGGIPEMLDGGDAGVLVPPDDVGRLGDALIQVVRDPLRRTALGQAARARVERHHDVHVVWQRLDDLYRELLPGSVANGAVPAPGGARR